MTERILALLLVALFSLSLIPTTDVSAQFGADVDIDPEVAIPGETLHLTADGLGTDSTILYEIWVEDDEGQRRFERHNQSTGSERMEWDWQVSPATPTGDYQACIGYWYFIVDGDWDSAFLQNLDCDSFLVKRRDILLVPKEEVVLAGSTITIEGLLSHPWTGEPEAASRVEWVATYTIDEDGSIETREHSGSLQNVFGSFEFSMVTPLNIAIDDWNGDIVTFQVWANGSSQEVDSASTSVEVGEYEISWLQPASSSTILLDQVLHIEAWTEARSSHDSTPLPNQMLGLNLWQEGAVRSLNSTFYSGTRGHVSELVELGGLVGIHSGAATLELVGYNPNDGEEIHSNRSIWISSTEDLSGQGIEMRATVQGGPFNPGDTASINVVVTDLGGEAIPNCWVHWLAWEGDDDWVEYGTVVIQPPVAVQLDSFGKSTLELTIPSDFRGDLADIEVSLVAFNATGESDSEQLSIPVLEPDIHLVADRSTFSPGDQVTYELVADGFDDDVRWTWTSTDGQSGGLVDAGTSTNIILTISETFNDDEFILSVHAVDGSGHSETDEASIFSREGYVVNIDLPSGRVRAGEEFTITYQLHSIEEGEALELPMSWETTILGSTESTRIGVATSPTGTLIVQPASDLEAGSYILYVGIGTASTLQIVEVVDSDSSDIVTTAGDTVQTAAPTLAIVALLIGVIALILAIFKGKEGNEPAPLGTSVDDPMTAAQAAQSVPAAAAPPAQVGPDTLGAPPPPTGAAPAGGWDYSGHPPSE
jgi:hypothetical protein